MENTDHESTSNIIDETGIETTSGETLEPKLKPSSYRIHIKRFELVSSLSRLYILGSFILIGLIVVIGFWNGEYAFQILEKLWGKLAAVYLVIFGNVLGKNGN